jgi:hypothetical protein
MVIDPSHSLKIVWRPVQGEARTFVPSSDGPVQRAMLTQAWLVSPSGSAPISYDEAAALEASGVPVLPYEGD